MSSPLSPDQWQQLESLVDALLDTPPERRAALFAVVSGGDPVRRAELERLVAECERAYPLLEKPAADRFAALVDTPPLQQSQVVADRYRIIREIGRGGMATVYLAHDTKHARDVALKVVRSEVVATVGSRRFLREIEIAAQLRHPHIVPLYDSGEVSAAAGHTEGITYYVMPYEAGHSLRERLRRDGRLSVDDTVTIVRDVCEALAYAHAQGVVHRDIKPDNVLLSGRSALVTDFGVARAATEGVGSVTTTGAGVMLGTPAYMAPEQVAADPRVDHRADIYAVGILAYELLAGRPPFVGELPQDILAAQLTQLPEPLAAARPDVPDAVADVVMKCLEKKPADRWQDADEIVRALDAPRPSPVSRMGASTATRRWVAGGTILVGAAGIVALGLTKLTRDRHSPLAVSTPRLAVGILPVQAASARGDLDWLATGLRSQLSIELAEVSALELRPTETIDALMRSGWTLDSLALAREVDYFVRAVLSKGESDSLIATLELIERGIRSVRAGFVRVSATETSVENVGRRVAERLRPMLGSQARERELERGSANAVALQLRRRADHHRLIARERLAIQDLDGAARALDSAVALLVESQRRDPKWAAPRLARASLSGARALVALQKSRGADTAGVRQAFDSGITILDSLLRSTPRDASALALRGRLKWAWARLREPSLDTDSVTSSAERDLESAFAIDTSLARAAADLSEIYSEVYARYDLAIAYAERADRLDSYMEESSQIINRLALGNLELNRDADAARWCHEGVRRFPTNPAHSACLLEVMAWGSGPANADSAWAFYHDLGRLTASSNAGTRAFYALEVAAVLARSRGVPRDSVRAVLARAREEIGANSASPGSLLPLEAAVYYRLGDSARADDVFGQLRQRDPRKAAALAQRRMLRDYVGPAGAPNKS